MAVQFYACNSLFTPLSISGEDGRVDHERLHTRRHTYLSADCSPHTRRIAGGGADSRISELSVDIILSEFAEVNSNSDVHPRDHIC